MQWKTELAITDLRKIGEGGYGTVYSAQLVHSEDLRLPAVVKAPRFNAEGDYLATAARYIGEEARILTKLAGHTNIIQLLGYGAGKVNDISRPFMVLEDGGVPVGSLLRQAGGTLSAPQAGYVALEMLAGLEHAHARGVFHRDIKPNNVLVDWSCGRVKLIDFGIAISDDRARSTSQDHLKGTFLYVAPEAIELKAYDARSDLWSVGVMLYEMCTGRVPFPKPRRPELPEIVLARAVVDAIVNAPLPELPRAVPQELAEVIRRLTRKKPTERYGSAEEASHQLKRFVAACGGPWQPANELAALARSTRRADHLPTPSSRASTRRVDLAGSTNVSVAVPPTGAFGYRSGGASRWVDSSSSEVMVPAASMMVTGDGGQSYEGTPSMIVGLDASAGGGAQVQPRRNMGTLAGLVVPEAVVDAGSDSGVLGYQRSAESGVLGYQRIAESGRLRIAATRDAALEPAETEEIELMRPRRRPLLRAVVVGAAAALTAVVMAYVGTQASGGELNSPGRKAPVIGAASPQIQSADKDRRAAKQAAASEEASSAISLPVAPDASIVGEAARASMHVGTSEGNADDASSSSASRAGAPARDAAPVKAEIASKARAVAASSLKVVVLPAGAFISLDGQSVERAPFTFENLKPGKHVLRLGLDARLADRTETVRVKAGSNHVEIVLADPFRTGEQGGGGG